MSPETARLLEPELHRTNERLRDIARRNAPPCFVVLRATSMIEDHIDDGERELVLLVAHITPQAADRLLDARGLLCRHGKAYVDRAVIDLGGLVRGADFNLRPLCPSQPPAHVGVTEIRFAGKIENDNEGAEITVDYWESLDSLEDALGIDPITPGVYASSGATEYLNDYSPAFEGLNLLEAVASVCGVTITPTRSD
jgi:hypothetical protein